MPKIHLKLPPKFLTMMEENSSGNCLYKTHKKAGVVAPKTVRLVQVAGVVGGKTLRLVQVAPTVGTKTLRLVVVAGVVGSKIVRLE